MAPGSLIRVNSRGRSTAPTVSPVQCTDWNAQENYYSLTRTLVTYAVNSTGNVAKVKRNLIKC